MSSLPELIDAICAEIVDWPGTYRLVVTETRATVIVEVFAQGHRAVGQITGYHGTMIKAIRIIAECAAWKEDRHAHVDIWEG